MSQYNLRQYLEAQSDRTEAVLAAHRAPARITGGTVGPRLIRLFLNPAPHTRFATIQGLTADLALALRAPSLRIGRGEEGVILELPNPHPRPVSLLTLLPEIAPLPPLTAMLGLTDAGVPLLARLSSPDVSHVLVSGATGAGKSALLRTMAVSLVLSQSAADLRLLCLDPQGRTFGSLVDAPQLLRPPVAEPREMRETLRSLLRELEIRDRRNEDSPAIVLLVDKLTDLVSQRGHETGIHVVAATRRPAAAILSGLLWDLYHKMTGGHFYLVVPNKTAQSALVSELSKWVYQTQRAIDLHLSSQMEWDTARDFWTLEREIRLSRGAFSH